MKQETSTRLVVVAAAIVSILCVVVHASTVPVGSDHHLVHSLATFATTNSFLYTNKIGPLNYRFAKSQLSPIQRYVKFGGFPEYQEIIVASPEKPSPSVFKGAIDNVAPVVTSVSSTSTTEKIKLVPLSNISRVLTPPFPDESTTATHIEKEQSDNSASDPSIGLEDSDKIDDLTFPNTANNKSTNNEKADPDSNLANLFNRVINAPFRGTSGAGHSNTGISSNLPHVSTNSFESPIQSRQDSNFEQPITFFQTGLQRPTSPGIINEQRTNLQLPSSAPGNYRFPQSPTLQYQQPTGNFLGNNRFAIPHNNPAFQRPEQLQPIQPHSPQSQQSFTPGSQFPQSSFQPNLNGFPASSTQGGSSNPQQAPIQLSSPIEPQLQYPGLGAAGPPPLQQEPENGYNPFHLRENFPEPPYESEFANDPPLDYEETAGTNNAPQPPPSLNFAQSTLRNVKTEELLDVVQRKQIPSECVYNTISYGPNGEDCVEAKKK